MEALPQNTYCLYCMAGREDEVVNSLTKAGYQALSPIVQKWKPVNGKLKKYPSRLLPGYVFFDAEPQQEPRWNYIRSLQPVIRVLQYSDGTRVLQGADQEFSQWLKRCNGNIDVSQVIQVGTKIQFISGPLKEMSGLVVKVNKNRKQVAVNIGDNSIAKVVWCGIEYVETDVRSS